jgi:hypothetical protein
VLVQYRAGIADVIAYDMPFAAARSSCANLVGETACLLPVFLPGRPLMAAIVSAQIQRIGRLLRWALPAVG